MLRHKINRQIEKIEAVLRHNFADEEHGTSVKKQICLVYIALAGISGEDRLLIDLISFLISLIQKVRQDGSDELKMVTAMEVLM